MLFLAVNTITDLELLLYSHCIALFILVDNFFLLILIYMLFPILNVLTM